ncbi:hypothetical protein MuYL_2267 [Mucilaginibacter xinganensis]|uniref:Uncharacterized protein n=1 Tax=Mucilaginibacter xinganensis TaxID=1234841 RepID=A0A223NWF9_9SPHI|nr:hypothetical protein MuYL_2267 [Mucilaginibacter xinganensis]
MFIIIITIIMGFNLFNIVQSVANTYIHRTQSYLNKCSQL